MQWRILSAWFALLVVGGASAMLFWSSFNRVVGGFGTGRDWLGLVGGLFGVLVSLVVARWYLQRTGALVGGMEKRAVGDTAGEGTGRRGQHVAPSRSER
jgi:hypothetical protein